MKEKKKKSSGIYLVIILLVVGAIIGVYLLKEDKTNDNKGNDITNQSKQNKTVIEEDIEEVTDNSTYVRKTFISDDKIAKIEYKYENSTYEIKINDKKVKNEKITSGGDYQIEQLNDVIFIAIETNNELEKFCILAFNFTGKQIITIDDYVDEENYMSLREYGDSDIHDNWAFQIEDSLLKLIAGRVNAGVIDGISDPCNESEIREAKITDDTMMAAQYSIAYLGNNKFSDAKIERINIDYLQYKSVFPCR